MTPKEKANALVLRFLIEVESADRYNYNLREMNLFIAKDCAKIAVNELIQAVYNPEYWIDVLGEIPQVGTETKA
jgi:hypothetical protein